MFQQIIRLDVNNKSNFACSFYYHKKTTIVATQIHMIRRRRLRRRRLRLRIIYYPRLLKGRCAASHASSGFARGGFAPAPTLFSHPRIIYDGNESINNSRKKHTPGAGAQPPRERSEPLYVFLKKCGTSARREWSIFFKNTHTQTSTPSTNPYNSNLRHAHTHRIKSRAISEYQPVQNSSYFCPIRWNNPPVGRNETR